MGKIIFHGIDENGNPVYTIGCGASKVVVPAMKHLERSCKTLSKS